MLDNLFGIDPKIYLVNSNSMRRNKDVIVCYGAKDYCKVMDVNDAEHEILKQNVLNDITLFIDEKMYATMGNLLLISGKEKHTERPSFSELLEAIAPKSREKSPGEQIRDVKKRLKHCKNFMERKSLEKELASLYKLKKGKTK